MLTPLMDSRCIGCPLAIVLGFSFELNVTGFWIGIAAATTIQVRELHGGGGCRKL